MGQTDYLQKIVHARAKLKRAFYRLDECEWKMYLVFAGKEDISAMRQELQDLRAEYLLLQQKINELEREIIAGNYA